MITAYSPLTLLWVLPYDFLVSILDSLASLLLGQWKPAVRHIYSWAWNVFHLPSTLKQRRRLRPIRSAGDEELFRFHAKGSVRLRAVGEELSGRLLSLFDDDQALARSSRRMWSAPGVWGAVVAAAIVFLGARAIIFGGMPNAGFSFPFEPPSLSLQRWYGGWNESGLGSASAVHPATGLTGLLSLAWFGAEGAARTLMTVILPIVGIIGMGRLGGRMGLRGPGRYLAGLVLIAGPGTAMLVERGSWMALCAAALLPWAVRAAFVHPHEFGRSRLSSIGWALLMGLLLAAFSPLLVLVPLLVVAIWRLLGGDRGSPFLAVMVIGGGLAGALFLIGDPGWLTNPARGLGVVVDYLWPMMLLVAAVPLVAVEGRIRLAALSGGVISLAALAVGRLVPLPPGVEEAIFLTASLGAALAVAGALDSLSRDVFRIAAAVGGLALLVASVIAIGGGRLGLPTGDVNERLSFATTLAEESGSGRILHASADRKEIPGEARSGPGFWYRVLDGDGTTLDEVWLPDPQPGDEDLDAALVEISSGADLRPGSRLSAFAIDWVVLEGPPFILDDALTAQLDLVPLPLDPGARVYENFIAGPIAGTVERPWEEEGLGFSGPVIEGRVPVAMNYDSGWDPDPAPDDWLLTVDGSVGSANWSAPTLSTTVSAAVVVLLVASLAMIVVGRRRS